ncbi:MAG: hypothetical protein HOL85_14950 [Rhodospirillaceae bacterium]|nr:hypothetical protein [Rhodospirillaceae bacterium]MBT6139944.1 hypothetical protein [Rhodospirillaceae bacterium]
MPTGLYFPTTIYCDEIPISDEDRNDKLGHLYEARARSATSFKSMSHGAFTSFNSEDMLHKHHMFSGIYAKILEHATLYAKDLGADVETFKPHLLNSWGNIYPKGEYVRQHHHANSVLSGVYYLSCPPGTGGTYFVNPLEYARAMDFPFYTERNMKNFEEVYFDEQSSRVIIFPGWLKHYTDANKADVDRVILSFNIGFFPADQSIPDLVTLKS